ncbi:MAG: M14 family metallocarboxypeptidase, partial [Oscillospiraceae bacterium]|nr:M14 family metallocarboxypeptidase [Oscillospiraceae bacterium]
KRIIPASPPYPQKLGEWLSKLKEEYPFIQRFSLGYSVEGRPIHAVSIGNGSETVFYAAAFHALEWLTAAVLLRFMEDVCIKLRHQGQLGGVDLSFALQKCRLVLVPMVNPDGVYHVLNNGWDKRSWQANSRGVDLNHNYGAGWDTLHQMEIEAGITGPGPTRYGGTHPESEPETRAITGFCRKVRPSLAIAFHSQGEEIYWDYPPYTPPKSKMIARILAAASGYEMSEPVTLASHGGFKDWFVKEIGNPAFTIEIGKGQNPLPIEDLEPVYKRLIELLAVGVVV